MSTLSRAKQRATLLLRHQQRKRAAATARVGRELNQLSQHKSTRERRESSAQSNIESVARAMTDGVSSQNLKLVGRYVGLLHDGSDSVDQRIEQLTAAVTELQKAYMREKHREELLQERLERLEQEHEQLQEQEDARTLESARAVATHSKRDGTSL
jgi:hypothetical protein